jgi:hypothetical protein
MIARLDGQRMLAAATVSAVAAAGALLAGAASATARPARASGAPSVTAPVTLTQPTPPAVTPAHGRSFIPTQGDWEGTANGFAASFNLILDAVRQQRAGVPQYGIQDLVMLRPLACPPDPAHYGESILGGRLPSALGDRGSLGLQRFGLQGALTGRRTTTLQGTYSLPSCRGMLTWAMHPAVRRTVADGTWTVHYSGGEHSAFRVQAGGRLATSIKLPRSIASCNGLMGTLDVFIGIDGGAAITQSGVTLTLRFANGNATGTLSAQGCSGRPTRVTADHTSG